MAEGSVEMKPHHITTLALILALGITAAALNRDLTVSAGGISLAITGPPEFEGQHERTDTGWLVTGRAVIRATMPNGTIREIVVPKGETRRVRSIADFDGLTLEVRR